MAEVPGIEKVKGGGVGETKRRGDVRRYEGGKVRRFGERETRDQKTKRLRAGVRRGGRRQREVKPRANEEPNEGKRCEGGNVRRFGERETNRGMRPEASGRRSAGSGGRGEIMSAERRVRTEGGKGAYFLWVNWDNRSATTHTWTFCRKSMCELLEIEVKGIGRRGRGP